MIRLLAIPGFLVFTLMNALSAQEGRPDMPNIILVMADDLGMGDVGYTGFNPYVETPSLDEMARSGIRFDRFYSQSPVCSPTRGSILTGRHPFRYGIFEANVGCLRAEETTLPELLRAEGYRSGHFGKWHLGIINDSCHIKGMCPADPFDFAYDAYFATHHSIRTWNPNVHLVEGGPDSLNLDSTYIRNGTVVKELLYGDDSEIIMNEALDFLSANRSGPFFSTIWFHTPHKPVVGPPELKAHYEAEFPGELSGNQLDYYAAITAMDQQIGRLRDSLEAWGVAENTMLWFCSDNGPTGAGETGIFKGAKRHLYEGGVRVPGILVWPEKIKGSRIARAVSTTSDLLPTILDAIGSGQQTLQALDGVSLMPVIEDGAERRPAPLCFQSHGSMVCLSEDHKLMRAGYKGSVSLGLESGLIQNEEEWMLFDMHNDSTESVNIIAAHPELADSLKTILRHWMETVYRSFTGADYEGNYDPLQSYRFSGGVSGQTTEVLSENRLGAIYINGLIINEFNPDIYTYSFALLEDKLPSILAIPAAADAVVDTIILPKKVRGSAEECRADIRVLAPDGSAANYAISFGVSPQEANAYLEELSVNGDPCPGFSPYKAEYYIVLPYGTTQVPVVEGRSSAPGASVVYTQARQIANAKEIKRTATIRVMAENGRDSLEYKVVFSVGEPSANTFLSGLLINGRELEGFSPYQCSYYIEVADSSAAYILEGIAADGKSSVAGDTIFTQEGESEASSGSINIRAANGIAEWSYEVVLTPRSGNSGPGDTVSIPVFRPTVRLGLSVYPNPCSQFLNIETELLDFSASIFDISGRMLVEEQMGPVLDVGELERGSYILAIHEAEGGRVLKIKFIKL